MFRRRLPCPPGRIIFWVSIVREHTPHTLVSDSVGLCMQYFPSVRTGGGQRYGANGHAGPLSPRRPGVDCRLVFGLVASPSPCDRRLCRTFNGGSDDFGLIPKL